MGRGYGAWSLFGTRGLMALATSCPASITAMHSAPMATTMLNAESDGIKRAAAPHSVAMMMSTLNAINVDMPAS